jgi:hypothetical protein
MGQAQLSGRTFDESAPKASFRNSRSKGAGGVSFQKKGLRKVPHFFR